MKKFYLILAALVAAMTVNAADWYLCGSALNDNNGSWGDVAQYKFTPDPNDANVFTYSIDKIEGAIKVKETGTWSTSFGANGAKLQEGVAYKAVKDGKDIAIDGTIENATITINVSTYEITITGSSSENEYTDIYLVGDFGSGWNEAITTYPLKLVEGTTNTYEGKYNLSAATSYFKMKAGSFVYGTGGSDVAVELGESYTAAQSGEAFSIGEGEYTFKFVLEKNADTGVLTVAGAQIVTFPETMNVIGNVNGAGWNYDNVVAMTNEGDGIFTIKKVAIGGEMGTTFGYFSFCENGNATSWSEVGKRYGAPAADTEPAFDAANAVVQAGDPKSFKVEEGEYSMTLDLAEMTLTIEKIEAPQPVVANGTIAAGNDGWAKIGTANDPAGEFAPSGSYTVTYNADKTLTFDLTLDEVCVGLVPQLFIDGAYVCNLEAAARAAGSWSATTTKAYTAGDVVPFSFYCAYAGGLSETKAINYTVGDVTAIDAVEVEAAANVDVVTVLGVVVRHNVPAAEATQGLPAGLYIVGGQKVLVK